THPYGDYASVGVPVPPLPPQSSMGDGASAATTVHPDTQAQTKTEAEAVLTLPAPEALSLVTPPPAPPSSMSADMDAERQVLLPSSTSLHSRSHSVTQRVGGTNVRIHVIAAEEEGERVIGIKAKASDILQLLSSFRPWQHREGAADGHTDLETIRKNVMATIQSIASEDVQ
ncbi:hypothetical protein KIPB_010311, partial [Kipferlia bialata]